MERVRDSSLSRAEYLERIKPVISEELNREGVLLIQLETRPKHTYSLWKKLQRPDIIGNLALIYDLVALRLIVENTESCYAALGVIHKLFRPLPGRIKDYIALPKPNGYQSLHTTVFGLDGTITEIQIRTPEMHQEAEYGIAAHLVYKDYAERGEENTLGHDRFSWIGQLRRWQRAKTPQEFLESLKIDVFNDRIFVFTPKGDIIDLPEGATPVDFAYAIHSRLGEECSGAYVNGAIAPLSSELKNGDVVEILRQKNKKPSPGWLTIVKTASARDKIRSRLRAR
jgi:GTP pyrophosphokinase